MPELTQRYGARPFGEAVDFFRGKLDMPSRHWDDLWRGMHAKGFMVAGAMKAELLSDLRSAVDGALTQGETLETFRKNFDAIVEKHGWAYRGGRNWRSKLIYDTNLRTAYQAGRYRQMTSPAVTALRPYLEYRHGDSRNPRPQHLAWDGMVLRWDDPFWKTHYPPNGWGCRCRVFSMSDRDLKRAGKTTPDPSPEIEYRDWEDRNGNVHQVPAGVDPGWDYNVGMEADRSYRVLAERFETMDPGIAREWMTSFLKSETFQMFYDGEIKGEFPVAVLPESDREALGSDAQTVWLSQESLRGHLEKHPEITLSDYRKTPEIIDTGEVYKQGEERLVILKLDGILYRAVLKRTRNRRENYYLTLFRTDEKLADKQVREKYERIR